MNLASLLLALSVAPVPGPFIPFAGPSPTQERLRALVLTGENRDHDWRWTSTSLRELLEASGLFRVEIAPYPEAVLAYPSELGTYDVIVVDYDGLGWDAESQRNLIAAVHGGAGLVAIHAGALAFPEWDAYRELTFGLQQDGIQHGYPEPVEVRFADEHRIAAGLATWTMQDAPFLHTASPAGSGEVIAEARLADGSTLPVVVAGEVEQGRVLVTTLGHVDFDRRTRSSWTDPSFERLIVRGTQWAATGKVSPLNKLAPNTLTDADRAAGWRLLFDGQSLSGWEDARKDADDSRWRAEGDAIRLLGGEDGGDIFSEEVFRDFELELEWRVADGSEVAFAYAMGEGRQLDARYTTRIDERRRHVAAEEGEEEVLPEALRVLRPAGEYNHARVVAEGGRIEHWLNGIRVLTYEMGSAEWMERAAAGGWADDPALAEMKRLPLGRIALKDLGADVWYRNVKIRPLWPDAPVPAPVSNDPAYVELFGGDSFDAWGEEWWNDRVVGVFGFGDAGELRCTGSALGYLQTYDAWRDFELDLEYRFSPVTRQGGQGGILVRMQGGGFYPPCLEVRLTHRDAGAVWNHREFAMEPDRRRTNGRVTAPLADGEKPLGEWNRLRIRLEGEQLSVHLNDTLVNELSGVGELRGAIGLKSEGVEMHYRNVRLLPLE